MIIQGIDSSSVSHPLLVDASGRAIISAVDLTTTGGKILVDANGRVMVGGHGWIGGAWQKDPLRIGYSARIAEQFSNLNAAAGANTLTGTTVPAGEIWEIQALSIGDVTTAAGRVKAYIVSGSVTTFLIDVVHTVANTWGTWVGKVILAPGDRIDGFFTGCTLNDDIYFMYHGIRIDIDQ